MEVRYYLPKVEFITVGIFEEAEGKIFKTGEWYPAIVLSYSDVITMALVQLMIDLNVSEKDLFLVNFEKLKGKVNVIVCFKIKRNNREVVLMAEAEINDESISEFMKYLNRTKNFIISFGLWRPDNVISLAPAWHVVRDSFTEYDGENLLRYLCEEYH